MGILSVKAQGTSQERHHSACRDEVVRQLPRRAQEILESRLSLAASVSRGKHRGCAAERDAGDTTSAWAGASASQLPHHSLHGRFPYSPGVSTWLYVMAELTEVLWNLSCLYHSRKVKLTYFFAYCRWDYTTFKVCTTKKKNWIKLYHPFLFKYNRDFEVAHNKRVISFFSSWHEALCLRPVSKIRTAFFIRRTWNTSQQ